MKLALTGHPPPAALQNRIKPKLAFAAIGGLLNNFGTQHGSSIFRGLAEAAYGKWGQSSSL